MKLLRGNQSKFKLWWCRIRSWRSRARNRRWNMLRCRRWWWSMIRLKVLIVTLKKQRHALIKCEIVELRVQTTMFFKEIHQWLLRLKSIFKHRESNKNRIGSLLKFFERNKRIYKHLIEHLKRKALI